MTDKELLEIIDQAAKDGRTELDLSGKNIKSVPPDLGELTNLTWLSLSNNKITSVPKGLGELANLTVLDLSNNQLTSLPPQLIELTNLTWLNLSRNQLTSLPPQLGELSNLTWLSLSNNQLTSLPPQLLELTNLTELHLSGNQLTSVPPELAKLTNLTVLYLSNNHLASLPPELAKLTNLTWLYLYNNKLTSIPPQLAKLTNLTVLDLDHNQLTSLPPQLAKLTNLTELYLSENQLNSLPAEIGKLTKLTELDLFNNQLTSVPPELAKLTNLKVLSFSNNQLTSVPPELAKLTNLTWLYLSRNLFISVPTELKELANLTELDLSNNQLTSLPPELAKLTNLTELSLSNNQLTSVPSELGKLTKLDELRLDGNPLESPPPEVVKQGTKAILAYLRELAKGKEKRYEAKLLILGDANEGKTCVSRALRSLPFEHQVTTEGVDIETWTFEHPRYQRDKEKRITLKIWDFEGQEINHQSHQFFMTKRCLYLLVFKGRERFEMPKIEYWLDTIRSRAPESEVILVATECETRTPRVPVEELRARYPDLLKYKKCFFEVGCSTGKGVKALRKHIQRRAAKLEVMGKDWPMSYAKTEEKIKKSANKKAHISRRTLHTLFNKSRIDKDDYVNAANLMGDLGVVTHFPGSEDLKNFIVLRPQWLTKAISYVLENKQLEKDKGEITHIRLRKLWENKYKGLSETFHKCMREFELCYDLEYRNRHLSLVPLRFGFAKPKKIPWSPIPNAKERRIEYRFELTPPAGIMSRFIVKTHYMIIKTREMPKGVYWYNGVFLGTGEGENRSEALCEFNADKRVMSIQVRAAFPQNMVEQLNGFAQSVFEFFEGLKPERKYGCIKFTQKKELECAGNHSERRIFSALAKNRIIDCEYGWHDVDPKQLIYGFSSFGKFLISSEEMQQIVKESVKQLESDVMSLLVNVDEVSTKVNQVREQGEGLSAEIGQQVELGLRNYLGLLNEMLDNRDLNSAPAVVSIVPVDGSKFNLKNWFEKEYIVMPYCEYESGVHKVDFSVKFKKPREWWEKTAPKLAFGVKVLSAGIQIACAGLPVAVDPKLFETMKKEVEFMKELAGHLELEGEAASDINTESGELVEKLKGKGTLRDLRQLSGEDEKRIARMQLAQLLEQIAPKNYKARQWGLLRRVRMPDNTYRWLCAKHAEEYKK